MLDPCSQGVPWGSFESKKKPTKSHRESRLFFGGFKRPQEAQDARIDECPSVFGCFRGGSETLIFAMVFVHFSSGSQKHL